MGGYLSAFLSHLYPPPCLEGTIPTLTPADLEEITRTVMASIRTQRESEEVAAILEDLNSTPFSDVQSDGTEKVAIKLRLLNKRYARWRIFRMGSVGEESAPLPRWGLLDELLSGHEFFKRLQTHNLFDAYITPLNYDYENYTSIFCFTPRGARAFSAWCTLHDEGVL